MVMAKYQYAKILLSNPMREKEANTLIAEADSLKAELPPWWQDLEHLYRVDFEFF